MFVGNKVVPSSPQSIDGSEQLGRTTSVSSNAVAHPRNVTQELGESYTCPNEESHIAQQLTPMAEELLRNQTKNMATTIFQDNKLTIQKLEDTQSRGKRIY